MLLGWIRKSLLAFGILLLCFGLFGDPSLSQVAELSAVQESMRIGQYEAAIELAKQQVEKKTWNEIWPRLLATNYLHLGRYDEALEVFKASQERFSDSLRLKLLGHKLLLINGQDSQAKALLDDLTSQIQRSPWKYSAKSELVPLGEFFLLQGEEPKQVLKLCYDQALKNDPKNLEALKAIASMGVSKSDAKVAIDAIEKALKLTQDDPDVLFLAAESWASLDREKSHDYLIKGLSINPRHIDSLLKQAEMWMDSESYDQASKVLGEVEAVNPHHDQLWALRAAIAHLKGDYPDEGRFRSKALALRKLNPAVDYRIGKHLSLHYRFAEGAQYQKRAVAVDSTFHPATTQLAQDLLRLGREDEGWEMVELARKVDPYHVTSYNLQILRDQLQKYSTIEGPGFTIRMDATEAKIFGREVVEILTQAEASLLPKYHAELNGNIVVELFSKQRDFAVRTFGMPGGEGFLGVCFGNLITANSPTALNVDHNWKSVLWHEYCHVVTLNLTNNRIPRWLSEGISVYEERLQRANWGEPPNPIYLHWLRSGDFEPPSRMSRMFLSPKSPAHLQYAYFVASIVVEFWVQEFGHEGMLKLLSDLRDGIPIADAIARRTGSIEGLDQAFQAFAKAKGVSIAGKLDFEPMPKDQSWESWITDHPLSYEALHRQLDQAISSENFGGAVELANRLIEYWPEDPTSSSALRKRISIEEKSHDSASYQKSLRQAIDLDPHALELHRKLLEQQRNANDWNAVANTAKAMLEINPMQTSILESLSQAAEKLQKHDEAIRSLEALSILDPTDPADLHYRLANAYALKGDDDKAALRNCLIALEESPRFEKALMLLLKLKARQTGQSGS